MATTQNEPQLSELESLQLKANQMTDESLESTRRMITLCEDVSDKKRFRAVCFYLSPNSFLPTGIWDCCSLVVGWNLG